MEVIHVKINNKKNADLLIEMLSSMKFVSKVEKEDKTILLPSKKRKPSYVGGSLKKYANKVHTFDKKLEKTLKTLI